MITIVCIECGKSSEAQRSSAKFCSANCRVKFNNKELNRRKISGFMPTTPDDLEKKKEALKSIHPSIKTAAEILPPSPLKWVKEVEEYCEKNNCTHNDLIEAHKNRNKPPTLKELRSAEGDKKTNGLEPYWKRRSALKSGVKNEK